MQILPLLIIYNCIIISLQHTVVIVISHVLQLSHGCGLRCLVNLMCAGLVWWKREMWFDTFCGPYVIVCLFELLNWMEQNVQYTLLIGNESPIWTKLSLSAPELNGSFSRYIKCKTQNCTFFWRYALRLIVVRTDHIYFSVPSSTLKQC